MKGINIIRGVPAVGGGAGVTYVDTIVALQDCVPDAAMRRQVTGKTPMRLDFGA